MTRRFAILTPPLPSALCLVRLWGNPPTDLFSTPLPSTSDAHRLVRMRDVDEGVIARSEDDSWLFTPHGGAGVIDALRKKLDDAGYHEIAAPRVDEDFAVGMNRYQRCALELLPHALSDAAIDLLLAALEAEKPSAFDPQAFAAAWPSVKQWLSKPRVVIAGLPNAGKSTLFNALAERSEAIVSATPGTTRDYLSTEWRLSNGTLVEIVDTAGLRDETESQIEREGINLAKSLLDSADLVLVLQEHLLEAPALSGLRVATKCDAGQRPNWADVAISIEKTRGLDELERAVSDTLFPALPRAPLPLNAAMAEDAAKPGFVERWFSAHGN